MAYKRVLLKLSGEQLSGQYEAGIDPVIATFLAGEIAAMTAEGVQVVIVIGGGNYVRGAQIAGHGIKRVTGDHMGMLATMINALALTDIFEHGGVSTRCLSNIFAEQVAEKFVHRLASRHLDRGRVVIIAGGAGRPYMTTDTAAVVLALELDCDIVMKATKVDGVYDKDPAKNPDAQHLATVSHEQALANPAIKVMDKAALGLAAEHGMKLIVFNPMAAGNLTRIIRGEKLGTTIA